ncbi:response regulator transcription factor [Paenibacillus sp. B01]|uniref:response regulator transcription factor n=1 Tax=Paenibacillus sp. B01 TaxID=2660554 RepID=UPI00129A1F19|nr:response regulator transcription factor [Paenibacillus sp. B01]QGG55046.1 response regulator [Paenibacillus sp. B01]
MYGQSLTVLVVDDEERIRRVLRMYLQKEGYIVREAVDGQTALQMATEDRYDIILLDVMIPGMDGIKVCSHLRRMKNTPIIMLTAKGEEDSRLKAFKAGADDYVVKPFSPREVIYRVRAVLKRSSGHEFPVKQLEKNVVYPFLVIEGDARRVRAAGQEVLLTPKEFDLLHYLSRRPDKVFSREELLADVWHYEYRYDVRTVDTHVKRIREKLNHFSPDAAAMIVTVWGVGYKFMK